MSLKKTLILQIRKSRQRLTLLLPYTGVDKPVLWKTQSSKIFCPTTKGFRIQGQRCRLPSRAESHTGLYLIGLSWSLNHLTGVMLKPY